MKTLIEKFRTKRRKGFTLVELLVVVIILGILATISVPTYNRLIKRSRVADGLNVLDLLATAQDKYYIQHGKYSTGLAELNVPIKEHRVPNPNAPYTNIITKNFTYDKGGSNQNTSNCIFAHSNDKNMPYTLVKNYATKEPVRCEGNDCSKIEDFVSKVENLGSMCPAGQENCEWNEETCYPQQPLAAPECGCKDPYTPPSQTCKNGDVKDYRTVGDCQYTGDIPIFDRTTSPGLTGPDTPATPVSHTCGTLVEYKVCEKGKWQTKTECTYKRCGANQILDKDCNCVTHKQCDINQQLVCIGGYSKCDPCPNAPGVIEILSQMEAQNNENNERTTDPGIPPATVECYHCGYRVNNSEPECDYSTGRWYCPSNEDDECTPISGYVSPTGGSCDGSGTPGNSCGVKKLTTVDCVQPSPTPNRGGGYTSMPMPELRPVYEGDCVLKSGNYCFDGETTPCDQGTGNINNPVATRGDNDGVYVCEGCRWGHDCKKCPGKYTPKYRECHNPGETIASMTPTIDDRGGKNRFCGDFISKKGKCNITEWEDIWDGVSCVAEAYPSDPVFCEIGNPSIPTNPSVNRGGNQLSQCYVKIYTCQADSIGRHKWRITDNCEKKDETVQCETGDTRTCLIQGKEGTKTCEGCRWGPCIKAG